MLFFYYKRGGRNYDKKGKYKRWRMKRIEIGERERDYRYLLLDFRQVLH
jgi:hypothetical protein